jgi:hypothetical protein
VQDLSNTTFEQALARVIAGGHEKRASGLLTALGSAVRDNPMLGHALVGGGLGAAAGGAHSMLTRGEGEPRKGVLRSMLTGGLLGGAVGGGIGATSKGLAGLHSPGTPSTPKPGTFTDPGSGSKMTVDPKALASDPDLAGKLKHLSTPTLQTSLAGGAGSLLGGLHDAAPTTTSLAVPAAIADTYLHAPLVGRAKIDPGQAGGKIGRALLEQGLEGKNFLKDKPGARAALSGNTSLASAGPELDAGTGTWKPGTEINLADRKKPGGVMQQVRRFINAKTGLLWPKPPASRGLLDALGETAGKGTGAKEVANVRYTPIEDVTEKHTGAPSTRSQVVGDPRVEGLNEAEVGGGKRQGHALHPKLKDKPIFQTLGKTYSGFGSVPKALAARSAIYGLPISAEYLLRGLAEDHSSRNAIQDLMRQNAHAAKGG